MYMYMYACVQWKTFYSENLYAYAVHVHVSIDYCTCKHVIETCLKCCEPHQPIKSIMIGWYHTRPPWGIPGFTVELQFLPCNWSSLCNIIICSFNNHFSTFFGDAIRWTNVNGYRTPSMKEVQLEPPMLIFTKQHVIIEVYFISG